MVGLAFWLLVFCLVIGEGFGLAVGIFLFLMIFKAVWHKLGCDVEFTGGGAKKE